nr:HAD family phosphatase [Prevotella sp.]
MIKNIIFDLGGVIITIDQNQALSRFKSIGLKDAEDFLNPYTQSGIFGDLEEGKITEDDFIRELSLLAHKELTYKECEFAWMGYVKGLPTRNIDTLKKLRREGYHLILLSNTNPFIQNWAESDFDGHGGSIHDYFDGVYRSYEVKTMKPDFKFFRHVLASEMIVPQESLFVDDGPRNVAAASELGISTFCPENGSDWTDKIYEYLD